MAGRLQHPAVAGCRDCRCCRNMPVPAVGGRHVGLVEQPARVRRHAVLRRKDHAAEVAAGDAHAFLRPAARPSGAWRGSRGCTRSTHVELACASAMRGSVSYVAVSGGGHGRSTSQVSGTRSPGSCARRSCRIVVPVRAWPTMTIGGVTSASRDLGMALAPVDDPRAGSEVADELAVGDRLAELVEARFGCSDVDEPVEPFLPRSLAEVVEAGLLARGVDELLGVELSHGASARRSRPACGVSMSPSGRKNRQKTMPNGSALRCRSSSARPGPRAR